MAQPTTGPVPVPGAPAPQPGARTLLAAAVIVHDRAAGRILLLQRGERARFGQGMWDLPAGKSEPGEPITGTAVRELREETGLVVDPEALQAAHIVHGAPTPAAPDGFLSVVFTAREWSGEPHNREPEKHTQVCWADLGALPEPLVPSTAGVLRCYLAGGPRLLLHRWT